MSDAETLVWPDMFPRAQIDVTSWQHYVLALHLRHETVAIKPRRRVLDAEVVMQNVKIVRRWQGDEFRQGAVLCVGRPLCTDTPLRDPRKIGRMIDRIELESRQRPPDLRNDIVSSADSLSQGASLQAVMATELKFSERLDFI